MPGAFPMSSVSQTPRTHPLKIQQTIAAALHRARERVSTHWRSVVPSQRFAVEFDRRTVGIAVRVPGGFMFFSSGGAFDQLDGRLFPRARALERELKKVARRKRPDPVHRLSAI
jgi:hypothetical protein